MRPIHEATKRPAQRLRLNNPILQQRPHFLNPTATTLTVRTTNQYYWPAQYNTRTTR